MQKNWSALRKWREVGSSFAVLGIPGAKLLASGKKHFKH
jgi:hypothetical protein